jgi:single-strand DNA-binding protein
MNDTVRKQAPPGLLTQKAPRMLSVNKVRLAGRLTQDPEIRSAIGDKMIVHLNLALERPYQGSTGHLRQELTFVPVTVWDSLADSATRDLKRGSPIYVEGRLKSDRWKAGSGEVCSALKIEASKLQMLSAAA